MSLQTLHCKFFWTEKAAQASNESPDSWKTQPIRKKSIHIVTLTNEKQDQSCTYNNNTIIDNNKVDDNPANIAEITKEIFSCTNRGNKIRRRGRKHIQKHVKRV